mmetsp:Transcript_60741/g.162358  ORF Transcript_60741/g.162358 Transcript_60741/m.162358 type:complete len:248 (+) Transcript_60741:636-1379(+)
MRKIFKSEIFQKVSALIIFANFAQSIVEAQLIGARDNDPSRDGIQDVFERVNTAVALIFLVELTINAYGYWFQPFIRNPWSWLDMFVVATSLLALGPLRIPTSVIRFMRAIRIIRLFNRFTNLRKLITALTLSILPMFNAFMLFLLISSIYAIMGVSIFGHDYPEDFMVFDRAFLALFRITAGDTWVPSLPVLRDDGSLNWRGAAFVISYIMWVSSNHRSRVVLPLYLLYFSVSANHEFEVNSFCLV